jgi:YrbI family 3-deoxy-D-manno-octulosonate 8-phosphate phosphatase
MTSIIENLRHIELIVFDVDGTMTDGGMYYSEQGIVMKRFDVRDGMGIVLLHKAGLKTAIITSEETEIVKQRAQTLKIDTVIQGSRNKMASLSLLCGQYSLTMSQIAFIGDDVNDLACLKAVGFSMSPSDAHEIVKEHVHYVSSYMGGNGAVRECCDMILQAKGLSITLPEQW